MREQQSSSVEGEQRRRAWKHKKPSQERATVPTNVEPLAKRLKLIEEVAADGNPQPQADQPQKVCKHPYVWEGRIAHLVQTYHSSLGVHESGSKEETLF